MEIKRVIAVRADGFGPGSGYVVAPSLAVTSAHVVGPVGSRVRIFRPGHEPVFDAEVVWSGTPDGADDAALIVITDSRWAKSAGYEPTAVAWGQTVTFRPEIKWQACGVPKAMQNPGNAVD